MTDRDSAHPNTYRSTTGQATQSLDQQTRVTNALLTMPDNTGISMDRVDLQLKRIIIHDSGMTFGAEVALSDLLEIDALPAVFKRSLARCIPYDALSQMSIQDTLMMADHAMFREWLALLVAHDCGIERFYRDTAAKIWSNTDALFDQPVTDFIFTALFIPHLYDNQALGAAYIAPSPTSPPTINTAVFIQRSEAGTIEQAFAASSGFSKTPTLSMHLDALIGIPADQEAANSALIPLRELPIAAQNSAEQMLELAQNCIRNALRDCLAQFDYKE